MITEKEKEGFLDFFKEKFDSEVKDCLELLERNSYQNLEDLQANISSCRSSLVSASNRISFEYFKNNGITVEEKRWDDAMRGYAPLPTFYNRLLLFENESLYREFEATAKILIEERFPKSKD